MIPELVMEIAQIVRNNTEDNDYQRPPHHAAFMAPTELLHHHGLNVDMRGENANVAV